MIILIILICCQLVSNATTEDDNPVVYTKVGPIRGLNSKNGKYYEFLGIPYAQVDENNPFGAHKAQSPFEETFDAIHDSFACPHQSPTNFTIIGSLDCLRMNIYVPKSASANNLLPVLVWIFGGIFVFGDATRFVHGPSYIVEHDVIFITFNSRLNVYGYMCLDIPEVPGNQGLRDQEAALKWIQDNIISFGGNNEQVTISGISSGAMSADLHLRFGKNDLFNKVILESGTATSSVSIQEPDYNYPIKLAKLMGYETNHTREALKYLTEQDPHTVVAATLQLPEQVWPCVEKQFDGLDRFITDYARNVKISRAKTTSILLGTNNKERLGKYLNKDNEFFQNLNIIREHFTEGFKFTDKEMEDMEELAKHFYVGDKNITQDKINEIASFDSDFYWIYPTERCIREYLANGATNIFRYVFTYNGVRNFEKRKHDGAILIEGAFHSDEMGYLFDVSFFDPPNNKDQIMVDTITTLWTNFVKFGDPTPEVSELIPVKWPPLTAEKYYHLEIGSTLTVGSMVIHDAVAFWDLFYELNEKKRIGHKDTP